MNKDTNPTKANIFGMDKALSDKELKQWCSKAGLSYSVVDLDKMDSTKSRFAFIYTGNEKDEFNNGSDHHWMFLDGTYIFDSYGRQNKFTIPDRFSFINTVPKQLQQFNSTVCGEYCCAFYEFSKNNSTISPEDIGEAFSDEFGFTKDRSQNDKIVYEWFHTYGKTTE